MHYYKVFALAFLVITLNAFLVYGAGQQALRTGANDPQVQIAEDIASSLGNNAPLSSIYLGDSVALVKSLAPYVLIIDANGVTLAGSGYLNGTLPTIPKGALINADQTGEHIVTWQPQEGVREAIVIRPFHNQASSGYVVSGRSLREIEDHITHMGALVLFGWTISCIALALFYIIFFYFNLPRIRSTS